MAGVADRGRCLTLGHVTLEGGDSFNRSECLGARHLRRQVTGNEFGGRSIAATGLDNGVDVEGLPEVALAITDPPLGEIDLCERLIERQFDHRAGGLAAAREGERGEVALKVGFIELTGQQAGADITHGGSRVQAPGEPGVGRGPFEGRSGHHLGDGGMHRRFAVGRGEADGLEVSAILTVELLGERHQDGDGLRGLEITERDGDFATNGRRLVLGQRLTESEDVTASGAKATEGHESTGVVG